MGSQIDMNLTAFGRAKVVTPFLWVNVKRSSLISAWKQFLAVKWRLQAGPGAGRADPGRKFRLAPAMDSNSGLR